MKIRKGCVCSSKANHQPSLSNSLILTISKFQIMKKTYITPETLAISLTISNIIAASEPHISIGGGEIDADEVEVKEVNTIDFNLWDKEW